MDNVNESQEFSLDDILSEFQDIPEPAAEDVEPDEELQELLQLPELTITPVVVKEPAAVSMEETRRFEPVSGDAAEELSGETRRMSVPEVQERADAQPSADTPAAEPEDATPTFREEDFIPAPVVFTPRSRLRELKKKLVAGPERLYYELSETGVGGLQIAILVNVIIVLACVGVNALYVMDMIPENRLRLVIFSQVLSLLLSALMGCNLMLDSMGDILRGRITINTLLPLTFAACFVDAIFCLMELRIPCCSAFSLEITMALWGRYHRHTTKMAQMDTMRKAVRLHGIVKVEDYFEGKTGLLRNEGEVEDFMDTYDKATAPEKVQTVYGMISLLLCGGIAVYAGLNHGISMGVQILSTSLLVALPASFFIATTRPMAILEQRLHMVGAVLCGWSGVKGLCCKAAFPLTDEDLFPQGSTKLNGVKFYTDRPSEQVVSYTTALITRGGGGLVPVFRQLLATRNGTEYSVENFQNYGGGGIGGEVCGEPVLLGSLSFLRDMGVDIPDGTMVNQAVYAAIDGQLCAVYAISYSKMRSASAGLATLCGFRRLTPVMLCGDFMLTESFIRAKFEVKTRRVAFPSRDVREMLKQRQPEPDAPVLAMTTREELVSAAYVVTGARSLRTATKLAVAIHMIGGILGMLIMAALAILGNTELLIPTNILLYQLIWAVPGLLVTEWTRVA